jgi:hypothetical protein
MFSLDTPVIINGNLTGPNLLRTTDSIKLWDHEDINFARSISDIITAAH